MGLPNPYLLLACLVAAIGIFFTGFQSGRHWEQRDALASVVAAQNAAIERANKESEAETQRALLAAKAEADARAKAREARHKGELDAQRKANPLCSRDADSLGLLNSSISLANGEKDTTPVVSHPVRAFGETIKRFGFGHTDVGVPSGGSVRSVPSPAQ
jgi:hypothetical protein